MPPAKLNRQAELSSIPMSEGSENVAAYRERSLHLGDAAAALSHLRRLDWGFTDEHTRFLGHDLHPYPAKFIPQIPRTLIALLSSRGELVFDPFGGSGTTALEAVRLSRRAISVDANPVAALIGRLKTARVSAEETAELHTLHAELRTQIDCLPKDPRLLVDRYGTYAPVIANRDKWFPDSSFGELANLRYRIKQLESETAHDIALLALSRTVLSASFQDSKTRCKSTPREIPVGDTTRRYVREFEAVLNSVARNAAAMRYGVSRFLTGDIRDLSRADVPDGSVDLVVTSPPYGNATDFHLYHRFGLLWLGYDPFALGKVEIGSHLKHQREAGGFSSYFSDMLLALQAVSRALKNGRYAALLIGDSVYEGKTHRTAQLLAKQAPALGFDTACVIERPLHRIKRSFIPAGRRAASESLLVLRRAAGKTTVFLESPPYKLWPYEKPLRMREYPARPPRRSAPASDGAIKRRLGVADLANCRRLVFSHQIVYPGGHREPTWQAILENGLAANRGARKEPKYVTHGLHPYKGKFYPQLAKGLINMTSLDHGARILDPFCGSGTTLLEGHLNGYSTYGCDLHPLAALIARAKTDILDVEPDMVTEVVSGILEAMNAAPRAFPRILDQFPDGCGGEIARWFARPVAQKLNWALKRIRAGSDGAIRDFLEVVLSSIVREVSQQDPADLRIRYRKRLLEDADVLGLFNEQLSQQFLRIEQFWKVRSYAPNPLYRSHVAAADNRQAATYAALGLQDGSVDLVLTSPPYAMALPYIDTDRLSLLVLFGLSGGDRRPLEQSLIGSRELIATQRRRFEEELLNRSLLPTACMDFLKSLHCRIGKSKDAGFRRQNMPALLQRFLRDMDAVLSQMHRLCRRGAEAMIVIGDSRMTVDGKEVRIPTTDMVEALAQSHGFSSVERIDISVTTENLIHARNAITSNVVLRLRRQ